jgi:hypothetical protein
MVWCAYGACDREILLGEFSITGTVAAVIGGFAFSATPYLLEFPHGESMQHALLMLLYLAAHLCTLSAVTSCILYHAVNDLGHSTERVQAWNAKHEHLRLFPSYSFYTGCVSFIIAVVLTYIPATDSIVCKIAFATIGGLCLSAIAYILTTAFEPVEVQVDSSSKAVVKAVL